MFRKGNNPGKVQKTEKMAKTEERRVWKALWENAVDMVKNPSYDESMKQPIIGCMDDGRFPFC